MRVTILKETSHNEKRVSITPNLISKLKKLGYEVYIQKDAGVDAGYENSDYEKQGAIISDETNLYESEIFISINPPNKNLHKNFKPNSTLIAMFDPYAQINNLHNLVSNNINLLSLDCIPRTSRAQKMDVLSQMANIAGYKAVIDASAMFGGFLGGQITAAGKINPAKVLVIGAGVAGLSAIGTASSLGAIVRAFDTRVEVKEQVESMYAQFLEINIKEDGSSDSGYAKTMSKEFIEAEMALLLQQAKEVDIIITTALIPNSPSPKLITKQMVKAMKNGSIIVDLAAKGGGNCELTKKGEIIQIYGVTIIGLEDLPSKMPKQSSELYAANVGHLMSYLTPNKNGIINIDFDDEITRSITIAKQGKITFPPPNIKVSSDTATKKEETKQMKQSTQKKQKSIFTPILMIIASLLTIYIGNTAPSSFLSNLSVFMLSCFVGYHVIWNVTPALHTPLMSVTNAISGIIILGALVQLTDVGFLSTMIACVAILIASINIVGGFFVTNKTLKMFSK